MGLTRLKSRMSAGSCSFLEALEENAFPWPFQLLEATCLASLRASPSILKASNNQLSFVTLHHWHWLSCLPLSPRASHQCLGSSRWMLLSVPSHGGRGINSLAGPLGPAKAGAMPPLLLYLFPGVKWWVQFLPPSPHHPNLSSHGEAPANWPSIPAVAHNPSWSFTLLWAARESHCNGSSLPNARFFLTCSFSTVSPFPSTAIYLLSSIKHWWKDESERDTDLWSSVETNHKEERNWEKKA